MEFYQAKDKYVIGVCGGKIYGLEGEPEAFISAERPVPTRRWLIKTIKDRSWKPGQEWYINSEIREYLCGEEHVNILRFEYYRTEPAFCSGKAEFFVSQEYAKEKIDALKKTGKIKEYIWDPAVPTWNEVHQKKYYRRVEKATT